MSLTICIFSSNLLCHLLYNVNCVVEALIVTNVCTVSVKPKPENISAKRILQNINLTRLKNDSKYLYFCGTSNDNLWNGSLH